MSDIVEIIELARKIAKGELTKKQALNVIAEIERENDNPYLIWEVKRINKPWNKEYLLQLKDEVISGAASKDQLLYMIEVADYVYRRNVVYKFINFIYRTFMFIRRKYENLSTLVKSIIHIALIVIAGIIIFFRFVGDR